MLAALLVGLLSGCGMLTADGSAFPSPPTTPGAGTVTDPFYDTKGLSANAPGELLRAQELAAPTPDSRAWRILYTTVDAAGRGVGVTALVIAPKKAAPKNGRLVVSWGHGTVGIAPGCAPSLNPKPWPSVAGWKSFVAAGFVVVAADYPGLGIPNPPAYLVGDSEGHSMLDAARAVRHLPDAGASSEVVLWGHSQGGHAALFAAAAAKKYAPDLRIRATIVAAPPTRLDGILGLDFLSTAPGVTLGAYTLDSFVASYAKEYPNLDVAEVLSPPGEEAAGKIGALCLSTDQDLLTRIAEPIAGSFLNADPTKTEPWSSLLLRNSAPLTGFTAPILIAQGLDDPLIPPQLTEAYAKAACAAGATVQYLPLTGVAHADAGGAALAAGADWLNTVLSGGTPPSIC